MNITLASVPLPFVENKLTIDHQYNAITSWTLLSPRQDILLLGSDKGVGRVASEFGVAHVPGIERNELGDLSMRSIFRQIDANAKTDWICYIDTDVVLLDDFIPNFEFLVSNFEVFVSCAGRWDAEIPSRINFDDPLWQKHVLDAVYKLGRRGSDYCIYPRGFYHNMPDFSIGRGHWDGWRMGYPLTQNVPLVNIERSCKAVHQRHGHRWSGQKGTGRNKRLSKNVEAWINNATHYVERKDVFNA